MSFRTFADRNVAQTISDRLSRHKKIEHEVVPVPGGFTVQAAPVGGNEQPPVQLPGNHPSQSGPSATAFSLKYPEKIPSFDAGNLVDSVSPVYGIGPPSDKEAWNLLSILVNEVNGKTITIKSMWTKGLVGGVPCIAFVLPVLGASKLFYALSVPGSAKPRYLSKPKLLVSVELEDGFCKKYLGAVVTEKTVANNKMHGLL